MVRPNSPQMNLCSKKVIQRLLKRHKAFPKKRLGQNFLIDKNVLKKIMKAADLRSQDTILEIGSGIGNLTQELAKRAKQVISIEKDYQMIEILKETTKNLKNVTIIKADILKYEVRSTKKQKSEAIFRTSDFRLQTSYKVVANLPYYIVSPVIRKFLEMKNPPKLMVLMVQKEVAQRICAPAPNMSLLSVSVQFYAKPEIISFVSKKSFWPQPKVDSAILKIVPRESALLSAPIRFYFFKIVRAGFSQPRKQLINNLSRLRQDYGGQGKGLKINREKIKAWLLKNKIRPEQRAESLSIQDWLNLAKTFPKISV